MKATSEINPEKLVTEHSDYLLSFAMSKLQNPELSKDLVQDTFISALVKMDTFEHRSSVRTWLTSILNRKIIDHWRKAETRYTDPVSHFFAQDGDQKGHWLENTKNQATTETIHDYMEREESIRELGECIDTLPDRWKGIVSSKYFEEKESEEICKDYGVTSSNLWVIIHRAKLVLRDCLQTKRK